jgi:hypothetical protein
MSEQLIEDLVWDDSVTMRVVRYPAELVKHLTVEEVIEKCIEAQIFQQPDFCTHDHDCCGQWYAQSIETSEENGFLVLKQRYHQNI